MRSKIIRFDKLKIRLFESRKILLIQLDFGRYKKKRKIETLTLYDAISEKHKCIGDEVWLDVQDRKAIGVSISLEKGSNAKR